MNKEVAEAWVAALRSGKYTQAIGSLKRKSDINPESMDHCVLGVLCDLRPGVEWVAVLPSSYRYSDGEGNKSLPGAATILWSGIKPNFAVPPDAIPAHLPQKEFLHELNDSGVRYEALANIIEQHWEEM